MPLRITRFSRKALTVGVESHSIDGVTIKVYNPAKTVADGGNYGNRIGLDVAIEARRDCLLAQTLPQYSGKVNGALLRTVLCRPVSGSFSFFTGSECHAIMERDIIIVGAAGPVIDFAVFVSPY